MTFTFKVATLATALVFASSTFATCPSIEEVKAGGIAEATELLPGVYLTINSSNYNSDDMWIFGFAPVLADSEDQAVDDANNILSLMNTEAVEKRGAYDSTTCWYTTGRPDMLALAIKFDNLNQMFSPAVVKKLTAAVHKK